METERLFSYTWCPYSDVPASDSSEKPETLVEVRLEPADFGTRLVISESGFSKLPDDERRVDAMRRNTQGWNEQVKNIAAYLD